MAKTFIINPFPNALSKEEVDKIETEFQAGLFQLDKSKEVVNEVIFAGDENLKHTPGRVVVKVNTDNKNSHTFQDGTKIRLERKYNEFNRRITEPVNAIVISAEGIDQGAEILIHHNALHDVNRIFNYKQTSGVTEMTDIKYFSLPIDDCFAWKDTSGNWTPMQGFCFGLRVFEPYKGVLTGIEPKQIPEVLYITTGELSGNVCHVLKASDYEIVFQGDDGREKRLIRLRHYENEDNVREEIMAVSGFLTEKLINQELLIGLSKSDCKPYEINAYAD